MSGHGPEVGCDCVADWESLCCFFDDCSVFSILDCVHIYLKRERKLPVNHCDHWAGQDPCCRGTGCVDAQSGSQTVCIPWMLVRDDESLFGNGHFQSRCLEDVWSNPWKERKKEESPIAVLINTKIPRVLFVLPPKVPSPPIRYPVRSKKKRKKEKNTIIHGLNIT